MKNKSLHLTFLKPLSILFLITNVIGLLLVVSIIVLLSLQNGFSNENLGKSIELIIEAIKI